MRPYASHLRKRAPKFDLGVVLGVMEGQTVTVELHNNTEITGDVEEVDVHKNLTLRNVTYKSARGGHRAQTHPVLFIHSRNVRCVLLPNTAVAQELDAHAKKVVAAQLAEARKTRKPVLVPKEVQEENKRRRQEAFLNLEPDDPSSEEDPAAKRCVRT